MVQSDSVKQFIAAVDWRRYSGATFARALWTVGEGDIYCMGSRIVLRFASPADDWAFEATAGPLRITRGWITPDQARELVKAAGSAEVEFPDTPARLSLEAGSPCHWSLQPYYPYVRDRIGRPALMLQGSGQSLHQAIGLDSMRAAGRRLPALNPRAFAGWQQLGVFLGSGGQPLNFDESNSAVLEIAAPSSVFVESWSTSPAGGVDLVVGNDTPLTGQEAELCFTRHGAGEAQKLDVASLLVIGQGRRSYHREFERTDFPVQVQLVTDGEAVQTFELIPERTPEEAARLGRSEQRVGLFRSQRNRRAQTSTPSTESAATESGRRSHTMSFADLHPEIRDRCETMYSAGELEPAILTAFKAIEDRLRTLGGCAPEDVGMSLVTKVLSSKVPLLRLREVAAEQEAAHMLFRGAIGLVKNPRSHRFIGDENPIRTFEMLAFASHLMYLLDSGTKTES